MWCRRGRPELGQGREQAGCGGEVPAELRVGFGAGSPAQRHLEGRGVGHHFYTLQGQARVQGLGHFYTLYGQARVQGLGHFYTLHGHAGVQGLAHFYTLQDAGPSQGSGSGALLHPAGPTAQARVQDLRWCLVGESSRSPSPTPSRGTAGSRGGLGGTAGRFGVGKGLGGAKSS